MYHPPKQPSGRHTGRRNLLIAIALSIPGPLTLAISLLKGQNATQVADFVRRSCELLSILMAYIAFEITLHLQPGNEMKRKRLEDFVKYFTGAVMVFCGAAIAYVAATGFGSGRGSVTTSLIFAILGAYVNARLYRSYRQMDGAILSVQAKLHRVKMLMDLWMILVLVIWRLSPWNAIKNHADLIGSCSIALYIIWSGWRVLWDK